MSAACTVRVTSACSHQAEGLLTCKYQSKVDITTLMEQLQKFDYVGFNQRKLECIRVPVNHEQDRPIK